MLVYICCNTLNIDKHLDHISVPTTERLSSALSVTGVYARHKALLSWVVRYSV